MSWSSIQKFGFVVVLAFATACTGGKNRGGGNGKSVDVEIPGQGKVSLSIAETLRINLTTEPPSLDWHKATDTTSSLITNNIMEGLVEYNLKDPELGVIPALAEKWESNKNATKWVFHLRKGVKWTDGQEFQAQHVIDGWKRLLDAATTSEYSYFLFPIKNARAFNERKITDFSQVGVKATSPYEIEVELEKPMSYFPYLLTHHSTYPVRADVVAKSGDKWTDPANIVTLGPYRLRTWEHDKQILLERNDSYYGAPAKIKYILGYMIIEQATAINLYEAGKLDALNSLPSTELRKLKTRPEFKSIGSLAIFYYGMNVEKPPMNNPLVRKSVAHAVDRQQIVGLLAGGQIPMTSWIPAGMMGYDPTRGLQFDVTKAKEYLKKAGYGPGKPFPKLTLSFNTNEDHQRVAENVQAQLKANLGVDVELKNEEWKVYLNTLKTDPPHLFRFGWLADYPDPDNMINVLTSYSENNRTRWKNLKYDELVARGASETNKETRKKIYSDAQVLLTEEEAPVIPLYSGVSNHLIQSRVENYPVNAIGRYIFKDVVLK